MARYALVKDGVVVNMISLAEAWPDTVDPRNRWSPPAGHDVVRSDDAHVGWLYVDGRLTPPPGGYVATA